MIEARKLSFQEAWDSSTVFFVDEVLEQEIETELQKLLETSQDPRISDAATKTVEEIKEFL